MWNGFEVGEIDVITENLEPAGSSKDDSANAIPALRIKLQVTRVGDLWALDGHRVYCGDARNENSYSALMKDCRAQMVFTDPGYSDPIDGYVSPSEFISFLTTIFAQMVRNTLDGTIHLICMDWRRAEELISAARSVYSELSDVCVWVKDGARQGSLYRSQHELIFVFKNGTKSHRNNIQLRKRRRGRTNVWNYPSINYPSRDLAGSSILTPLSSPSNWSQMPFWIAAVERT